MSGNTRMTAEKIADKLSADLIEIQPEKEYPSKGFRKFIWGGKSAVMGDKPMLQPYSFDGSYDRVIFGSPVWASSFAPPIRSFIEENREALKGKRIGVFFCFSGGGADKAAEKLKKFLDIGSFEAELILIDPKDKPSADNDKKLADFCEKIDK